MIDKIMAEEDEHKPNAFIGINQIEIMKSSTGKYENDQQHNNVERFQYLDQKSRDGGVAFNELQNNNRGTMP